MKLGNAEGTPRELTDFFENNGLDPSAFFQKADAPLQTRWLVIPATLVLLAVFALWLVGSSSVRAEWPVFLLGCLATVWLSATTHLRYKQSFVTGVAAVGCLAVLTMALGLLTPLEAFEFVRRISK